MILLLQIIGTILTFLKTLGKKKFSEIETGVKTKIEDKNEVDRTTAEYKIKNFIDQLKNKLKASVSCNVSSLVNAMIESCTPIYFVEFGKRTPDIIMSLLNSQWGLSEKEKLDPKGKFNPWNYHAIIAKAVNKLQGEDIFQLVDIDISELTRTLHKYVYVFSGAFTKSGHFICVHDYDSRLGLFKVDDSWGNYNNQYKSGLGDDVLYSYETIFQKCFNRYKWQTPNHKLTAIRIKRRC